MSVPPAREDSEQRPERAREVIVPEQTERPGVQTPVIRPSAEPKNNEGDPKLDEELKEFLQKSCCGHFPTIGDVILLLSTGLKRLATREDACYIDGPIAEEEARRITHLACSVTNLSVQRNYLQTRRCKHRPSTRIPFATILQLSSVLPRHTSLFPNLQGVTLDEPNDLAVHPLLLSPSIRSLWFSPPVERAEEVVSEFTSFLQLLTPIAPHLDTVTIFWTPYGRLLDSLLPFKDSITELCLRRPQGHSPTRARAADSVSCDLRCPARVYSTLAQFTGLRRLDIRLPCRTHWNCLLSPPVERCVVKAKHLRIETTFTDFNLAFHLHANFDVRSRLSIKLCPGTLAQDEAAGPAFWRLLSERVPLPAHLHIYSSQDMLIQIPYPTLEFFLKANNITALEIPSKPVLEMPREPTLDLNDFLIAQFQESKVYPGRIKLKFPSRSDDPPLLLSSLLMMATVFPNLEELQCRVIPDATTLPLPIQPTPSQPPHPLRQIRVIEYPKGSVAVSAKDTIAIARALSSTFPNLKAKYLYVTRWSSNDPGIWEDIKEVMSFME